MKILQIGAGSMGTRRMRDLSARDDVEIALFDGWDERREKAVEKFGVRDFKSFEDALDWNPDTMIISSGPSTHRELIKTAIEEGCNCFCEASLFGYDYKEIEKVSSEKNLVFAPSFTLYFYPITEVLKGVISEDLGQLFSYHSIKYFYVPDWHPGQTAKEYYALNRSTAAAREVVPFELVVYNHLFDCVPVEVTGDVSRRGSLEIDSEDTWCIQAKLSNDAIGQIIVGMACPSPKTLALAVGSNGVIEFDMVGGTIRRNLPGKGIDDTIIVGSVLDVLETVYSNEINTFIDTVLGKAEWPLSYKGLAHATAALAAGEKSSISRRAETVDLDVLPGALPDEY